jgi:ABC-type spermidine/putrescine transport system permease subunit I
MMPSSLPAWTIIIVFFIATFTLLGSRGIVFACLDEANIPNRVRGLTIAVVSMIAYTTDLFIYKIYGGFLDNSGNDGYTKIFWMLVILSVITAILCKLAINVNKKAQNQEETKEVL